MKIAPSLKSLLSMYCENHPVAVETLNKKRWDSILAWETMKKIRNPLCAGRIIVQFLFLSLQKYLLSGTNWQHSCKNVVANWWHWSPDWVDRFDIWKNIHLCCKNWKETLMYANLMDSYTWNSCAIFSGISRWSWWYAEIHRCLSRYCCKQSDIFWESLIKMYLFQKHSNDARKQKEMQLELLSGMVSGWEGEVCFDSFIDLSDQLFLLATVRLHKFTVGLQ